MKNKLLTLESLVEYCKSHENFSFSAHECGHPLVVSTYGHLDYSVEDDNGLMAVKLKSCHTGLNKNNSFISKDSMERALPSFSNKPILAQIITNSKGEIDFGAHAMQFVEDDDGNVTIKYIERPVGIVPESCDAHLEYDKEKDRDYVHVNGFVFTSYGNETADILKRKGGTDVSIEIDINEMAWNAKEKYLEIKDFIFMGVTLLGDDYLPGMDGSYCAEESDFSQYSSIDYSKEINEMKSRLMMLENRVSDKFSKEGGKTQIMGKFEELLVQYGKSADEITFEYENLSDEELEAKFAEMFEEDESSTSSEGEVNDPDKTDDASKTDEENKDNKDSKSGAKGGTKSGDSSNDDEDSTWGQDETSGLKSDDEDTAGADNTKKKFELSMQDKISALTTLVNATYGESDNDWYSVVVYKDYVVMIGWWSDRSYKQNYKEEEDNFSLTGDRVEVYAQYLTQEEIDELAELRKNYAALVEYKANVEKTESDNQKKELLEDERFEIIKDVDAYNELVKDADKYSVEEIETKLKLLVADFALGNSNFTAFNKQNAGKMLKIPGKSKNPISSRYGGIFKN